MNSGSRALWNGYEDMSFPQLHLIIDGLAEVSSSQFESCKVDGSEKPAQNVR